MLSAYVMQFALREPYANGFLDKLGGNERFLDICGLPHALSKGAYSRFKKRLADHSKRRRLNRRRVTIAAMTVRQRLLDYLSRLVFATLTFLVSLLLAAIFVGSSKILEILVGLIFDTGTLPYELFKWVSSVALLGVALLITCCGAIVVCLESIDSTISFARNLRAETGAN